MDKKEYIEVLETVKTEIREELKPLKEIQERQEKLLELHNKCLVTTKTKVTQNKTDIQWLKKITMILISINLGLSGSIGGMLLL